MSVVPIEKSRKLILESESPLIFLPPHPGVDLVASAFALFSFCSENGHAPKIICESAENVASSLNFIHPAPEVLPRLSGARDFVLIFETKYNPISEVRTEREADRLKVYITPEKSSIDPRDFSFEPASFSHDLVITLGATDKEHLGKAYEENPDVFYEVPVVNIDHRAANELFGQVNAVDLTASTVSEVVAEIIDIEKSHTAPHVYEYLLAGIMSGTASFQKTTTSPKAFRLASLLMDLGADQQRIVNALYKTQPLHLLKLWGKVMAGIKWNEKLGLIWGQVSLEDFVQARASQNDLPEVLEKIRLNYQTAKIYLLLHQEDGTCVQALLAGANEDITTALLGIFPEARTQGSHLVMKLEKHSIEAAEEEILQKLSL
jgi:bifunctional oligoribonuclease and PAP phosphatase NrnA